MTPAEVADVLEVSGAAYSSLLKSIPAAVATWRPAEGEWCINECVGLIIEAEKRGFAGRIRIILAEVRSALQPWDQPAVARSRGDCEKSPHELLDEFEPVRRASTALVRSLQSDQLQRQGIHPKVGSLTVNDLIHEWVHHDGNHLRQAYANLQAYVWPEMGNTQKFSRP